MKTDGLLLLVIGLTFVILELSVCCVMGAVTTLDAHLSRIEQRQLETQDAAINQAVQKAVKEVFEGGQ